MRVARFFDLSQKAEAVELSAVPPGGTRAQAMQRLQIGIAGVLLMILMVGLASVIQNRAKLSDAGAVPEAAPTTEPTKPSEQSDPLAEAGVVPDMPKVPATPPSSSGGQAGQQAPAGTSVGQ